MAGAAVTMAKVLALSACAAALRVGSAPEGSVDVDMKIEALQPVLEKLRGLDPKSFSVLSSMMKQSETTAAAAAKPRRGASLAQAARDDPDQVQMKLEKIAPLLGRLKQLNPRVFGALNSVVSKVQQEQFQAVQGKAAPTAEGARQ